MSFGGSRETARGRFTAALIDMLNADRLPACAEPEVRDSFVSEHFRERVKVLPLCSGCPLLVDCDATAVEEGHRFGVWGGKDRAPLPRSRRGAAA